jgi:hypothetical protein
VHTGAAQMRHRRVELLARAARKHRERTERLALDLVDLSVHD